jgi:hypothetical protein
LAIRDNKVTALRRLFFVKLGKALRHHGMESGSDNDTATRGLLNTNRMQPGFTGLQGSGHCFAAAAKCVDNKLSNHIRPGHRFHALIRRFEERSPLRGGCLF